jgi:CheY-like chemotaxis protein
MQMAVVASLTAATAKGDTLASEAQLHKIVEVVRAAGSATSTAGDGWKNHILWVDDKPENKTYERQAFETIGLYFTLALSTDEAFERLAQKKFAAIISDMGRREGPREGYVLLDRLRKEGNRTPFFFYAASNAPEHKSETREHGGQGCTNNAQELFEMVTRSLIIGGIL